MPEPQVPRIDDVRVALRASWARDTAAQPGEWTPDRPSHTQCDASSLLAWELLGGDLVLARVLVDGELTQHHYWNRIDGVDVDFTADQFDGHEQLDEIRVVTGAELRAQAPTMRAELRQRVDVLRQRVRAALGDGGATVDERA